MAYEAAKTDVPGAYMIVLSGFDCSNGYSEASFKWPNDQQLTIPRTMVLMDIETFNRLTKTTHTVSTPR